MTKDIHPNFDHFLTEYNRGRPQVLTTSLPSDLDTPVAIALKLGAQQPYSALLESVEDAVQTGRFSMFASQPDFIWQLQDGQVNIAQADPSTGEIGRFEPCKIAGSQEGTAGVINSINEAISNADLELPEDTPPMCAGLYGYFGYECVRLAEPKVPDANNDTLGVPDSVLFRPQLVAVLDNLKGVLSLYLVVRPREGITAKAAYATGIERLQAAVDALDKPLGFDNQPSALSELPTPASNMSADQYKNMVAHAKEYIAAGDIFQVVLSQRFETPFDLDSFALYRALRRVNPSPFLFHVRLDGFALVGSSPEILVKVSDSKVTIRPIAGTRPRQAGTHEDELMAAELLADEKERAEHLMLLDLGRNDVGRVSNIGSVRVTDKMIIERFSHVMHITSNVVGDLKKDVTMLDAMLAGFPAGTVSGAPKIRAMEIIHELEPDRRGVYAGSVGFISARGELNTCIALRTGIVKDGKLYVQAGAGVVADSDPDSEHLECQHKAKALATAADLAIKQSHGQSR